MLRNQFGWMVWLLHECLVERPGPSVISEAVFDNQLELSLGRERERGLEDGWPWPRCSSENLE